MIAAWRRLLLPLVPLYSGIIHTKQWLRRRGYLTQHQLRHPVISVGSLSAGGAGKTPVVSMFAKLLKARGLEVRILTRGYGRGGKATMEVHPDGDARQCGDEPLMLAQSLPGARIFVGRDRHCAGLLAESNEAPGTNAVYLLDDGFQHQQLARQIEIVLITQQDLEDVLLPAGNLRGPLRSIGCADFVVLREAENKTLAMMEARLSFTLPPILTIRRKLTLPNDVSVPSRPLLFCGLARPEGFIQMLGERGILAAATHLFPDHHRYSAVDVEKLVLDAQQADGNGFLTTEKDAVKLTSAMRACLQSIGPVLVIRLEVELLNEASAIDAILARIPLPT